MKVAMFVLVYLLSGCDFLLYFHVLSFLATWYTLLKGLLVQGLVL